MARILRTSTIFYTSLSQNYLVFFNDKKNKEIAQIDQPGRLSNDLT